MDKQIISQDMDYYRRTVEKIYKDYYLNILLGLSGLLVSEIAIFLWSKARTVNGLFILITLGSWVFFFKKRKAYSDFLKDEMKETKVSLFSEDENYYYIQDENLKFSKKKSRNLPSKKQGITFFIGVQPLKFVRPVSVRYYDMLEITYTDKFRLSKNNVSFVRSRWKYRIRSWIVMIPVALFVCYTFFFRLSFIGSVLMQYFVALFYR